jgi:hypothetical protein
MPELRKIRTLPRKASVTRAQVRAAFRKVMAANAATGTEVKRTARKTASAGK